LADAILRWRKTTPQQKTANASLRDYTGHHIQRLAASVANSFVETDQHFAGTSRGILRITHPKRIRLNPEVTKPHNENTIPETRLWKRPILDLCQNNQRATRITGKVVSQGQEIDNEQ